MDKTDREKIEKIIQDREEANKKFASNGSKVYKNFLNLEREAFSEGELKKMHKELIALGISIVINCESCIEWHIKEALNAGASEKQILEAIEVGIEMGGGPATVSSRFALKVLEYHGIELLLPKGRGFILHRKLPKQDSRILIGLTSSPKA